MDLFESLLNKEAKTTQDTQEKEAADNVNPPSETNSLPTTEEVPEADLIIGDTSAEVTETKAETEPVQEHKETQAVTENIEAILVDLREIAQEITSLREFLQASSKADNAEDIVPSLTAIKETLDTLNAFTVEQLTGETDNADMSILCAIDKHIMELSTRLNALDKLEEVQLKLLSLPSSFEGNISNMQKTINNLNETNTLCIQSLKAAAEEIPPNIEKSCTEINKAAIDNAVANFRNMDTAAQKWVKKFGQHTDFAAQSVAFSAILTPILLIILLFMVFVKL